MADNVDSDQTAPIGAVCSWSTMFDSILYSSGMLGNNLQQTTSADDIFRCIFLGGLRVNKKLCSVEQRVYVFHRVYGDHIYYIYYCKSYYMLKK